MSINQSRLLALLGYNARRAYVAMQAAWPQRMEDFALTPTGFSLMVLLADNPGTTQKVLCATLKVPPPNMVVLVDKLVARGLALRTQSATDKRVAHLSLTPAGEALVREAEQVAHAIERDATPMLSDSERATLNALLQKVLAA
jgi:DNA-binding MarR family transcriptional regulator